MSGQISPQRGGYASYAIRLMKINGTKLSYFRDVTAWKRSWIKEKIGKKNMEMDDTVMYYIVHLTLGCFVASNRMQMRIYELQFFAFSALAVDKCWWCRLYSHAKMDAKIFWTGRGARLVLPYTKYSIRQSLYNRTPILQKAKKHFV